MTVLCNRLARQLRGYRRLHALTQCELATEVGGITGRTISRYECGASFPDPDVVWRLANLGAIDVAEVYAPDRRRRGAA